jgi:hypothetical protein
LQKFSVAALKSTFIAENKEQKYLAASPNLMLEQMLPMGKGIRENP